MTKVSNRRYIAFSDKQVKVIQEISDERGTNDIDFIRQCVRLGIMVYEANQNGERVFIRDSEGNEREIVLI